jgi:hypothetical protein
MPTSKACYSGLVHDPLHVMNVYLALRLAERPDFWCAAAYTDIHFRLYIYRVVHHITLFLYTRLVGCVSMKTP